MAIETEVKYLINKLPHELPNPLYIEQRYFEPIHTLNIILELFNLETLNNISTKRVRLIKTDKITFSGNHFTTNNNDIRTDVKISIYTFIFKRRIWKRDKWTVI